MLEEVSDAQWALIAPLLPLKKRRGRPRADDRWTFNGILWVLRSGARWCDLPAQYGSDSTCHRRLQEWQEQGVWERIWRAFLSTLPGQRRVEWERLERKGQHHPSADGWGRHSPGRHGTKRLGA